MSKLGAPYAISVTVGEVKTGFVVDENNKPSLFCSYNVALEMVDRLNLKSDGHARFSVEASEFLD